MGVLFIKVKDYEAVAYLYLGEQRDLALRIEFEMSGLLIRHALYELALDSQVTVNYDVPTLSVAGLTEKLLLL